MIRSTALGFAVVLLLSATADAQTPLALALEDGAPRVDVGAVLNDETLRDAVESGLPLRLRFHLELWRDRFFDRLEGEEDWTVVVAFEPLERVYLAGLLEDSAAAFPTWESLRGSVERAYYPAVVPPGSGRFYYIGQLEIETLSLSDLDELERWLRGELEPAVQGRQSVSGAIGNGLKRVLVRVLSLPARRYEVRSGPIEVP